jgi:predicted DCC family thiol-disulfide oxidoreductase YuxK
MRILFFDGFCSLCNGTVNWLMSRAGETDLKFASLQGSTAQKMLADGESKTDPDTVIYLRHGVILKKSEAVIFVLGDLGGVWKVAHILFIIPRSLRDFVYDLIARNRYCFFPKRKVCRIPTEQERVRFLD